MGRSFPSDMRRGAKACPELVEGLARPVRTVKAQASVKAVSSTGRRSAAPLHTPKGAFSFFQQFPELHLGLFGKSENFSSDLQCAELLGFKRLAKLNQVHGNTIHIVHEPSDASTGLSTGSTLKGDGLITDMPDLALSIRCADCQAFAVYAPKKKVLGLIHAGWRGMAALIIPAFYEKLEAEFSIKPEETFVYAAPSICLQCAEFWNPTHELPEHLHPFIDGRYVDLQKAADAEMDALGVPKNQRERHPSCTKCDENFWSYRGGDLNKRNYLVVGLHP